MRANWSLGWMLFLALLQSACVSVKNTSQPEASPNNAGEDAASPEVETSACRELKASPALQHLLQDLAATKGVDQGFGDYRLHNHDLLLEWRGDPTGCVAHWSKGDVKAFVPTQKPLALSTPYFGFLVTALAQGSPEQRLGGFLTGDAPTPLVDSLKHQGTQVTLVLLLNIEAVDPGFLQEPEEKRREALNYFAHHESFHANVWLPNLLPGQSATYPWPAWSRQPDKNALVASCYGDERVQSIVTEERATLMQAVEHAWQGDLDAAQAFVDLFLQHRRERYKIVEDVRIPQGDAQTVSCAVAEAVWEMDEGSADFIAMRTLEAADLWSRADILARLRENNRVEPYYHFGAAQLLLLHLFFPDREQEILRAILLSSSSDDGIHGTFARWLGPKE